MSGDWNTLFRRYPASSRPTSAVKPLGNAGGLSGSRLYRFTAAQGPLVARRWPANGPPFEHLVQIHGWLRTTRDLGFVAVPLPTLDGSTLVEQDGSFWEIAPWMPGVADLSRPPGLPRLRAAFAGLASFLGRLASQGQDGPSPGLALRVAELERLLLGEFDQIRALVARSLADPAAVLARRWLDRAVALAPSVLELTRKAANRSLPLQPCLRDVRPDHFLFVEDRLAGLVDFGAMGRDSVAGDLARLLDEGVGLDRRAGFEAFQAFEAIRPLSGAEHDTVRAFRSANALLGAGRWSRWHFLEARTFDDPGAVVNGLTRTLERLDEAF